MDEFEKRIRRGKSSTYGLTLILLIEKMKSEALGFHTLFVLQIWLEIEQVLPFTFYVQHLFKKIFFLMLDRWAGLGWF